MKSFCCQIVIPAWPESFRWLLRRIPAIPDKRGQAPLHLREST